MLFIQLSKGFDIEGYGGFTETLQDKFSIKTGKYETDSRNLSSVEWRNAA